MREMKFDRFGTLVEICPNHGAVLGYVKKTTKGWSISLCGNTFDSEEAARSALWAVYDHDKASLRARVRELRSLWRFVHLGILQKQDYHANDQFTADVDLFGATLAGGGKGEDRG